MGMEVVANQRREEEPQMRLATFWVVSLIAGLGCAATPHAWAQDMRSMLTLATAKKMVDACEQKAKAEGWKVIIAIVDDGGNLKYFSRMDESFLLSVKVAQLKANTSAAVPFSSRRFGEIAKANPGVELVPGTATFPGGLPIITASGKHLGGIGVSGASADQDEACAQVALDAVKDVLK
jgi:glc operon protein GlcG